MGREERARAQAHASRVMLAFPAGADVRTQFCVSLAGLVGYELAKPVATRKLSYLSHAEGLYVSQNRQHITDEFFCRQESWLCMVDADIKFPPTLLESMVDLAGPNAERKIVAANVPLGYRPNVAFMEMGEPGQYQSLWPLPAEPVRADGVATAVVLIHRDVIVDMYAKQGPRWFQHWYPDSVSKRGDFNFVGEDLAFCRRAKEAGWQSWVGHVKGLVHLKIQGLSEDEPTNSEKAAEKLVRVLETKLKQVEAREAELAARLKEAV